MVNGHCIMGLPWHKKHRKVYQSGSLLLLLQTLWGGLTNTICSDFYNTEFYNTHVGKEAKYHSFKNCLSW